MAGQYPVLVYLAAPGGMSQDSMYNYNRELHCYIYSDLLVLSPRIHEVMAVLDAGADENGFVTIKGFGTRRVPITREGAQVRYSIFAAKPRGCLKHD